MKLAVLPLNAAEGTRPALGRQMANFASDTVRAATGAEINTVSYLAQVPEEGGPPRAAFVNVSDTLLEPQWLAELFQQSDADRALDGVIRQDDGKFEMTVRVHEKGNEQPIFSETWTFPAPEIFPHLHRMVKLVAENAGAQLPAELAGEAMDFGTDDADAFVRFLEGYDALMYIQQANGAVAREFSPQPAIDSLLAAVGADPDFLAPYETLVQLCRACGGYRIGTFDMLETALKRLVEMVPDDYKALYALGELHQGVNDWAGAADWYEKAFALEENEPALLTRLGLAQLNLGMPVNAERNLRRAVEMEDESKPSMDFLAGALAAQNREHEVPALWKGLLDAHPGSASFHAKYAMSLFNAGLPEEGRKAFELGLEKSDEPVMVKRFYAPVLAQSDEIDRAMDFYEDCLDVAPNDVDLLLEYARTLQQAGREFEIPNVLKDVLASSPDANVQAQTQAWLLELEQPKRAESVENARTKMESGDFEGAIRDLKPLRNWLADYWKMWALLAAAYNKVGDPKEAEDAARRLLGLFPACEPGYGELLAALSAQGKHEEAHETMRFAAGNMPGSVGIHINLALAAHRAGHKEEARSLARQIREALGGNQEVEAILAEVDR